MEYYRVEVFHFVKEDYFTLIVTLFSNIDFNFYSKTH